MIKKDCGMTKQDYEIALSHIEQLMGAKPGTANMARLNKLTALVGEYEEQHYPIQVPIETQVPDFPGDAFSEMLKVMQFGLDKHGEGGYFEKNEGHNIDRALAHIDKHDMGDFIDEETDLHTLAHAAARILFALQREMIK